MQVIHKNKYHDTKLILASSRSVLFKYTRFITWGVSGITLHTRICLSPGRYWRVERGGRGKRRGARKAGGVWGKTRRKGREQKTSPCWLVKNMKQLYGPLEPMMASLCNKGTTGQEADWREGNSSAVNTMSVRCLWDIQMEVSNLQLNLQLRGEIKTPCKMNIFFKKKKYLKQILENVLISI